MRVAVLTLTRDRLAYTQHCFDRLEQLAGVPYVHLVLDQGSRDGTPDWLDEWERAEENRYVIYRPTNIGVSRGINLLLDTLDVPFDIIVKFDNDCELTVPGTLRAACEVAATGGWLASPQIHGLDWMPPVQTETTAAGYRLGEPPLLGGIFLAAPASAYSGYRHDETNPVWGMDDVNLCGWWRNQGRRLGYLLDYPAWHYETTQGQRARYPDYFRRKNIEFAA